jgi:hypothetical protein
MSKPFKCRLGLHHWHYDCKAAFPSLYVEAVCYYCGKEDLITGLSAKSWFRFSESSVWDKHNPGWRGLA